MDRIQKKLLLILIIITSFFEIFSQNSLKSLQYEEVFLINNIEEIIPYLENKFELKKKQIQLKKSFETSSLTGKHISYSCSYKKIELEDVFIKIHINKQNQIFFIQENISKLEFQFINTEFNTENLLSIIKRTNQIYKENEVYKLINNFFEKVYQVVFINPENDIYTKRTYFSESEYEDQDLKIYSSPNDTIIKGSAFMPDPLTSSEQEYGNNFQDGYKKDTSVIDIKTIPNTGQTMVSSGIVSFTIYGNTYSIDENTVNNNFSGEIYFYLKDIYIDGGQLIGYNSLFTDDLTGLKTQIIFEDNDFIELNHEQFDIEVKGIYKDSKFQLKNEYFEISEFSNPEVIPFTSATNNFSFNRSESSFEDINAFYHLNNFHEYFVELGISNLDNEKIIVDVHGNNKSDNSYFTYNNVPILVFGEGGVDDAEDASVVIHEYTHAISHLASPNTNTGKERRALDEALGDYFSSSYRSTFSDYNLYSVFPWDGHNEFWDGRITNSDSTYFTYNDSKSIYFNTEIMSATLMDVFNKIGKEATDILVLESLFYNTKNNTFKDYTEILSLMNKELFNYKYITEIDSVLFKRKFIDNIVETDEDGFIILVTEEFMKGGDAEIFVIEDEFKEMDVWITNSLGKIVYKIKDLKESKFTINSNYFYRGIYYVRLQTNNNKYKTKLIKL